MDVSGSKHAEALFFLLFLVGVVVGLVRAVQLDDASQVYKWYAGAAAVALVACVPAWPCFRRHALPWAPVHLDATQCAK